MKGKLWFSAKKYGWGWYPSSWEGWMITLLYALILTTSVLHFQKQTYLHHDDVLIRWVTFGVWIVIITGLMIWICYKKGDKPKWRWG